MIYRTSRIFILPSVRKRFHLQTNISAVILAITLNWFLKIENINNEHILIQVLHCFQKCLKSENYTYHIHLYPHIVQSIDIRIFVKRIFLIRTKSINTSGS